MKILLFTLLCPLIAGVSCYSSALENALIKNVEFFDDATLTIIIDSTSRLNRIHLISPVMRSTTGDIL